MSSASRGRRQAGRSYAPEGHPRTGRTMRSFPSINEPYFAVDAEWRAPATGDVSLLKEDVEGDGDQNEDKSEDHRLILCPAEMLPPPIENADIHGGISLKC